MNMIGKVVVVGITFTDENNDVEEFRQVAGTVTEVSEKRILLRKLGTGGDFGLPPWPMDAFEKAIPGTYKLVKGNVASVTDPDFTNAFEIVLQNESEIESIARHGFIPE
jgi:hypothetical protein